MSLKATELYTKLGDYCKISLSREFFGMQVDNFGINDEINPFPNKPMVFTCLQYKSFRNTVGKGEMARKQAISPFSTVFSTLLKN